ncbi:uncharacterized protein LOC130448017 [Diorhabda sublineata]|uniref:uncharacterized protein LOC130448017 n=1 Tax=Diorhabda sublineata TaxID=1163346 RepID=UPI0024E07EE3|nr:uncharacterized protein LOC130448017 [Diorhabda sublineata]
MAAEEIKSTIDVRKLISVFENRVTETETHFRPRTRSLGHLLPKDTVVPVREFKTLKEVERVLEILENELGNYEIYNKAKHVAFQENLFNTLTSIINIDTDDQVKADNLIKRTKMLVTILNNKLPSNNTITLSSDRPDGLQKSNIHLKSNQIVKNAPTMTEIESNKENGEVNISVKKLKEKFQSFEKKENTTEPNIKTKITYSKSFSHGIEKNIKVSTSVANSKTLSPKGPQFPADEDYNEPEPVEIIKVQVNKLRNLFEKKSQEGSSGISLVLKENRPPITRFNYKSNQDVEPEIVDYNSNKITRTESNRLLNLIEKSNENVGKHFEHELNISEKNEDGDIIQIENKQNIPELGSMSNLEPIEDEDSTSDISSTSQESLKTVESIKLVDDENDQEYTSIKSDPSYETEEETFTSIYSNQLSQNSN